VKGESVRRQNLKWAGFVGILVLILGCVGMAQAQQTKKVSRIGYLSSLDPAGESTRSEGIRLALRELGYIEGQNIAIEYRYSEGKNATKTIPIVMVGAGNDPVEAGLIESLARPGGNITGLTNLSGKLGGKQLELLKEAVPKLARVAVLYERATPANVVEVTEDLPVAARALKLTVQPWEVRAADGFERAFAALNKQRPDGLYVPAITVHFFHRNPVGDRRGGIIRLKIDFFAFPRNFPAFGSDPSFDQIEYFFRWRI
jgi:putative ABC transport system substrate-binding protein